LYCILSQATAFVDPSLANQVQQLLRRELDRWPPYAVTGFPPAVGKPRELYEVPAGLRASQPVNARSHLGVYAFWMYCHRADDSAMLAMGHWQPIKARCRRLLDEEYAFDIRRTDYRNDEAQVLNGDLAGLIGLVRLARLVDDQSTEQQALRRAAQLLQLRVNLDRVNPVIVHSTQASTARLHHFKLTRYCDLVPEVARAVQLHSDDCASARLHNYRSQRNGWYIAAGDRLIGGENYTNPLHFSRSLFAGAALIEQLPAEELAAMIDVPWCRGDLYFIEKCVLVLWASEGSKWKRAYQRQE
jgi:hypothetical protein